MNIIKRFIDTLSVQERNNNQNINTSFSTVNQIGTIFQNLSGSNNLLSNASVIRGIAAISNAISSMHINEYKIINNEKIEVDTNLEHILNCSPNNFISATIFKKQLIENVFQTGNSLIRIERSLNNEILSLVLLDSNLFTCNYDRTNCVPHYYYSGKEIDITDYLLIYFYPHENFGGYFGKSLIQYANEVLKKTKTVENFESNYFNGSAISGILSPVNSDRPVPKQQAEQAKRDFFTASSQNGIVVLDGQMKYDRISTNAKDNALLEIQQFNVSQIARILNIPSSYLFSDNNAITEADQITFYSQTLQPLISIIENEMKRKFFFRSECGKRSIEFDYESLIKSDRQTLASYYSQLFNLAAISPNEICKKLNLPTSALEGMDSRYILQNAQPIDINLNLVKAGLINNESNK